MVFQGAAPDAPGAGVAGATTVIPSQMMNFPADFNYSTFLDARDRAAPEAPRRSRRSRRHRTRRRRDNHRRSSSQSSGSDESGTESPYSSDYDSEYSRHRYHNHNHNPLPRPPKDILSSTPFRPILSQLPSAQYNSWGIGGTVNMPQPQPQPPSHQPTTYGNIRPRRTRRGLFNRRERDRYPASSGAAANHMAPPFIPPSMSMPEPQYAPEQQQGPPPGVGPMTPAHGPPGMPTNSPMMQMPSPDPAPPLQQGPVIPPGTIIPMPTPAPAGSTPYIGAHLGTPRTPRGAQTPGPGPSMQMTMMPSPSSGHVPMPSPMPSGGGATIPMPSPAVGTPRLAQGQMMMPPPGSVLVNAAMTMPEPSLGPGGGGSMAPVLKFNGYGEFSGLLYHSPHSVVYEEELYPTALHLFEARKFLDHRPDLADRIRQCERVEDVTAISAELADFTRRDWGNVALSTVSNQPLQSFFCLSHRGCVGANFMLIARGRIRWTRFYISSSASMASCALYF